MFFIKDSDSDAIDHIIEEAQKYKSWNAELERRSKFDSFLKYKVHCAENRIKSFDYDVIEEIKCIKNGVQIPGNLIESGENVYTISPIFI